MNQIIELFQLVLNKNNITYLQLKDTGLDFESYYDDEEEDNYEEVDDDNMHEIGA